MQVKKFLPQFVQKAEAAILLICSAHGASAANNSYWVEMYTNQPIVDG